jgi:hypothetical protein
MNLHEQMNIAVEDAHIDLDRLTRVARTQGTRAVRRRNIALPVAALVLVGVGAVMTMRASTEPAPVASSPSSTNGPVGGGPDLSTLVAPTGPGAVAALRYALHQIADGKTFDYTSQGPYGEQNDLHAAFAFTSNETGVTSSVEVGVTTGETAPEGSLCGSGVMSTTCADTTLPDGNRLTVTEDGKASGLSSLRRTAILWRTDGVQVTVTNNTGQDLREHTTWDSIGTEASLSADQLTAIARQPWWGTDLPQVFVRQGQTLNVSEVGSFD